jgi:4-aminobutyrate aminotransferase/(S)-3-amino-2-methylpropionate transaminase
VLFAKYTSKYRKLCILLACGNFGNVIRTLMAFEITDEQLEKGSGILEESLYELGR